MGYGDFQKVAGIQENCLSKAPIINYNYLKDRVEEEFKELYNVLEDHRMIFNVSLKKDILSEKVLKTLDEEYTTEDSSELLLFIDSIRKRLNEIRYNILNMNKNSSF